MIKLIIIALLTLSAANLYSQANRVVGYWLTDGGESQVEIFRNQEGGFNGRLVWLKEPLDENRRPKVDDENPDVRLRNRRLDGLVILSNFVYDATSREWKGGTIYDPQNGRTYDAYMWFDSNGKLNIRGFVLGMRLMGRSTVWTRETQERE